MRISIIIPALNEAEHILQTLLPLQGARVDHRHEVLLVDGGSSDATIQLAAPMVDRVLSSRPGRATQMITGVNAAEGELFWFLHADTVPSDNAIQSMLDAVQQQGALFCWGRFDVRIDAAGAIFRVIEYLMNRRSAITSVATGDQAIFITRDLYAAIGGMRQMPLMEDIEISKRLRKRVKPVCLRGPVSTSARRWQHSGIVRTVGKMWLIRMGFVLGVSPQRLAHWYCPQAQTDLSADTGSGT